MNEKKKILFIDEPYTCTLCGRQNLKFEEIVYKEDMDGQINLSSVTCKRCGLTSLLPFLLKITKPGHEKEMEKLLENRAKQFERNYNRRMIRRVLKGSKEKEKK